MKRIILVVLLLLPLQAYAAPLTFLEMHSEQGDYIGQGLDYYFTEDDGDFSATQSYFGNPTYLNNSVDIRFVAPGFTDYWYLSFSTHEMGIDLTEGTYQAVRFPFEPAGSAGLSVSGNGRGSNTLTGSFTIHDIAFGAGASIERFAATFEQHSAGFAPALFGTICYNSNALSVPEPATMLLLGVGMVMLFGRRRLK